MRQIDLLLRNILKIYVGKAERLPYEYSQEEWIALFQAVKEQSIIGVTFDVVNKLSVDQQPPKQISIEWMFWTSKIKQHNLLVNAAIAELHQKLGDVGLKGCILKGQGVGLLYKDPLTRNPGDIDVWCKGTRGDIIRKLKDYKIRDIVIHHAHADMVKGVSVEVHFVPSWFYCPFTERRFRNWYNRNADEQFLNVNDLGYCTPTPSFNLVYSLTHIYKHLFDEGIGLRQLMDYYYILKHSTSDERNSAFRVLSSFKMSRFVGAVMYVMFEMFELDAEYMLCKPSEKYGKHLLDDILIGGNFGQYNKENFHEKEILISRGLRKVKRNLKVVTSYPSEVIWAPMWKCWHWAWRKWHGYM